jgi:hypothetical protein
MWLLILQVYFVKLHFFGDSDQHYISLFVLICDYFFNYVAFLCNNNECFILLGGEGSVMVQKITKLLSETMVFTEG